MGGAALRQRESIPALEIPRLSTGEIDTFYREGFLIIRSVFSQGEVLRIAGALDRLYETAIQLGRTTLHRGTQFVVGETERGAPRVDRHEDGDEEPVYRAVTTLFGRRSS